MSTLIGKFLTILGFKRREANILVVGLDNSGKSTILNYLKRKEDQVEEVVPTVGFTVERLSGLAKNKSGLTLTAFDMSGQGRYRNLWEHYYSNVEGIIFVVDSTDALRLVVARDELEMMLKHQKLQFTDDALEAAAAAAAANSANGSFDGEYEVGDDDDEEEGEEKTEKKNGSGKLNGNHGSKQSAAVARLASKNNRKTFTRKNSEQTVSSARSAGPASGARLKSSMSNSSLGTLPANPNATFRRPDIPILFFANKMDLKDALPSIKISQLLGLQSFPHKNWHIQASNAITGDGIQDGIEWLIFQISNNKKLPNSTSSSSISSAASSNSAGTK